MSHNKKDIFLKFKFFIVKFIILIGQKTFLGRGTLRKFLINTINFIIPAGNIRISRFICYVKGVPFNFYNDNLTGIKFYFGRNETKEIEFIKKNSTHNSTFIDIGANMGLYAQNIASLINSNTQIKIICIEPHIINCERLKENFDLLKDRSNDLKELVKIKNCAVGEDNKIAFFDFTNGLANGFIQPIKDENSILITSRKLNDIVVEENLTHITNLKIDIEGYEDRALIPFFETAKTSLFPKNILMEHSSKDIWERDLLKFLFDIGYQTVFKNKSNIALSLKKKLVYFI